jgi:multidrug efflux pump subunit AcrB
MKLSHFFVDRPIFATVLSVVIVIAGAIAYYTLPVAQYPEVVPPTVVVRASYPGANPEIIAETVATPSEQEINGVEDINLFGLREYSMRVWLNPERIAARNLTAGDVVQVLREQNVQVAAGVIGQPPVPRGGAYQLSVNTLGRLLEAEQFGDIVIKTGDDGRITRLRDVARVELGARDYSVNSYLDGKPAVAIAVTQRPGSNALATATSVRQSMAELSKRFPEGLEYRIVYDPTVFVQESVNAVLDTLIEAFILVFIVVLLFLQNWRATLLPMIDVPVSLIGTFAVMAVLGFSLNNLSLFGLVLAIGIVVDDAIVVVENIERWMAKGLEAREATLKAMDEITGPVIAITLVLSSVFIPTAFITGLSGQFYRQFALTIAASTIISAINALPMAPARAVQLIKPHRPEHAAEGREALPRWGIAQIFAFLAYRFLTPVVAPQFGIVLPDHGAPEGAAQPSSAAAIWALRGVMVVAGSVLGWFIGPLNNHALATFFRGFNRVSERVIDVYGRMVASLLRISAIVLIVYGGLLGLTYGRGRRRFNPGRARLDTSA